MYFGQWFFLFGTMICLWIYGIISYIIVMKKLKKEEAQGGDK